MTAGPGIDPDILNAMVAMRRHLHAHPELSHQEHETQAYLMQQAALLGIDTARPAAGTGLVIDITGAQAGPNRAVAVRADIDGLPITEATGLPFASTRPGVMHACGHDAHTAMVFAAMTALHRRRADFGGTVRFIFQPAEETAPTGAPRILAEGWLDSVDAAIGLHVDPYLDSGRVAVGAGPYTLACDDFDITITGRSAHAAKPQEGVDAISIGCAVVMELQRLVSRETGPFDPLVLSVTRFHAGRAYNVLAETAELGGTLRSGSSETRARAARRLAEIAGAVAAAHGATAEVRISRGEPPVINDPAMVQIVSDSVTAAFGPEALIPAPGWEAADDFGYYAQMVPSVYFRLGVRRPGTVAAPLHHPEMTVDEDAMKVGAATVMAAALGCLSGGPV